jgi:hypothetical protein
MDKEMRKNLENGVAYFLHLLTKKASFFLLLSDLSL